MFRRSLSLSRYLAILILALVIASGAYALAAANSLSESGAGEGAAAITPYLVNPDTIHYTLDDQVDPTNIKKVEFEINLQAGSSAASPSEVYAQIDGGGWVSCANTGGVKWECSFSSPYPKVRESPLPTLQVAAAQ